MIRWLEFKAHDHETDFVARKSYFQAQRIFEAVDRADIITLPAATTENLIVLTDAIALQRFETDPTRHVMLIAGQGSAQLAKIIQYSIQGYSHYWQNLQSDRKLPRDLDTRIGYLRSILDRRTEFWT